MSYVTAVIAGFFKSAKTQEILLLGHENGQYGVTPYNKEAVSDLLKDPKIINEFVSVYGPFLEKRNFESDVFYTAWVVAIDPDDSRSKAQGQKFFGNLGIVWTQNKNSATEYEILKLFNRELSASAKEHNSVLKKRKLCERARVIVKVIGEEYVPNLEMMDYDEALAKEEQERQRQKDEQQKLKKQNNNNNSSKSRRNDDDDDSSDDDSDDSNEMSVYFPEVAKQRRNGQSALLANKVKDAQELFKQRYQNGTSTLNVVSKIQAPANFIRKRNGTAGAGNDDNVNDDGERESSSATQQARKLIKINHSSKIMEGKEHIFDEIANSDNIRRTQAYVAKQEERERLKLERRKEARMMNASSSKSSSSSTTTNNNSSHERIKGSSHSNSDKMVNRYEPY